MSKLPLEQRLFAATDPRRGERGQALVVMTIALAGLLAMAALIIDAGYAMAQHRATQNATDAAAMAGASVIVEELAGVARSDSNVLAAVQDALAVNDTTLDVALYVDQNNNVVGTVGQGGGIPHSAYGVQATGYREFSTFLAGMIGMSEMDTTTSATALAGAPQGVCPATEGCAVLPVTFSVPVRTCDGTNRPLRIGNEWPLVDLETAQADSSGQHMSTIPLCTNGPGGVGWLDMQRVGCSGNNLAQWITTPCNVSFDIPIWLQTASGNMNNVESALNSHRGKVLLVPMFDSTCRDVPSSGQPADCTNPGQGNNIWYHIPQFAAFLLHEAYVQGNDGPSCNSAPGKPLGGGNGATSCLKGWFVRFITVGPVGPPRDCQVVNGHRTCTTTGADLAVQLIR
ncbi:MAG TPA: pilus assembly protein TadG-related protein [Candidatus Limnocylindrales bacterium]|nr:pilus assembly protein TadG-related protein [Candidatus Limnocylindrales bacterium]